jgi:hypothetical protein
LLNVNIAPEHRRLRPFDWLAFKRFHGRDITILPYDLTPIFLPQRISKIGAANQTMSDDIRLDFSSVSFPFHAAYPVYMPFWLAELEELGGERRRMTGALLATKLNIPSVRNTSFCLFLPMPLLGLIFGTDKRGGVDGSRLYGDV